MSSDGYFEDDLDLDPAVLEQLDAIEAAHFFPANVPAADQASRPQPSFLDKDDSFDMTFDIDETELRRIDEFIEDVYQAQEASVPGPSDPSRRKLVQATLFGGVLQQNGAATKPNSTSRLPSQRNKASPTNLFGKQAPKTKQWDQTAFAKSGVRSGKHKGKGKARADDGDVEEDGELGFEQFPPPFVSG
jgi:ATP-dependent DNA helicase MPH1